MSVRLWSSHSFVCVLFRRRKRSPLSQHAVVAFGLSLAAEHDGDVHTDEHSHVHANGNGKQRAHPGARAQDYASLRSSIDRDEIEART